MKIHAIGSRALISFGYLFFQTDALAHEGHGIPGSLPPAPHGGVVQELKLAAKAKAKGHDHDHDHEHEHDEKEKKPSKKDQKTKNDHEKKGDHDGHDHEKDKHAHSEEPEMYVEATYKNKEVILYPLMLPTEGNAMFKVLSPQEFKAVAMKIEFPRKKTVETVSPVVGKDSIKAAFDARKANRFIIHLSVMQNDQEKLASIQLENG